MIYGFVCWPSRRASELHCIEEQGSEKRRTGPQCLKYGRRKNWTGWEDMKVLTRWLNHIEDDQPDENTEEDLDRRIK